MSCLSSVIERAVSGKWQQCSVYPRFYLNRFSQHFTSDNSLNVCFTVMMFTRQTLYLLMLVNRKFMCHVRLSLFSLTVQQTERWLADAFCQLVTWFHSFQTLQERSQLWSWRIFPSSLKGVSTFMRLSSSCLLSQAFWSDEISCEGRLNENLLLEGLFVKQTLPSRTASS